MNARNKKLNHVERVMTAENELWENSSKVESAVIEDIEVVQY